MNVDRSKSKDMNVNRFRFLYTERSNINAAVVGAVRSTVVVAVGFQSRFCCRVLEIMRRINPQQQVCVEVVDGIGDRMERDGS